MIQSLMDNTNHPSSLERLKALDSIPDLPSQLEEAKQLCTERSRANMIAKWIFKKLNTDNSLEPDVWRLLLTCFRVQNSPERIGYLVSSCDLLNIIETTLKRPEASSKVFLTLVEVLEVVLHKANGPTGIAIKAVLTAPASSAASFLGAWLRCAHWVSIGADPVDSRSTLSSFIAPAVTIWEWRKAAADETQLFSQHCLAPAALLMRAETMRSNKSNLKRKSSASSLDDYQSDRQILEKLLARHIFAPSRTAFLRATDNPASVIQLLLQPLREERCAPQVLPTLLDVALRSSSISTFRQRSKEAPWIEEVFQALLACNCDEIGNLIDMETLTQLLATVRSYASLSSTTLKALWERYFTKGANAQLAQRVVEQDPMALDSISAGRRGEMAAAESTKMNMPPLWNFVAELVASKSDIFDENATQILLETIGNHSTHTKVGKLPSWLDEFDLFTTSQIVVPIMRAFAKRREISQFMGIWSTHPELSGIADEFSELVEDSVTEQAFLSHMDQARAEIERLSSTDDSDVNSRSLFMITDALLAGLRNTQWLDAIHDLLGEMLDVLLDFPKTPSADAEIRAKTTRAAQACVWQKQYWNLLTRVFKIWSPSWIGSQQNDAQSNEERTLLMKGAAVSAALDLVGSISDESPQRKPSSATAMAAGRFLASMCCSLHSYKSGDESSSSQLCITTSGRLLESLGPASIELLAQYPGLFDMLDAKIRRHCLMEGMDEILEAVSLNGETIPEDSMHMIALQSIANTATERAQSAVVDDFIELLVCQLDASVASDSAENMSFRQEIALMLLCEFPTQSLHRSQRERIVDAIHKCQVAARSSVPNSTALLNLRLALMTKLMELSNATCILSTEPAQLWTLAHSVMAALGWQQMGNAVRKPSSLHRTVRGVSLDSEQEHLVTPKLLQQLIHNVIGHLLQNQDQERTRAALIGVAESVKTQIQSFQTADDLERSAWKLPIIQTMIIRFETNSRAGLKNQLAYREQHSLEPFFKLLLEHASAGIISSGLVVENVQPGWEQYALETLSDWPEELISEYVEEYVQTHRYNALQNLLRARDDLASDPQAAVVESSWLLPATDSRRRVLVAWFRIGCKYGSSDTGVEFALLVDRIFEERISPMQRNALVDAFEVLVQKLAPEDIAELISRLYPQGPHVKAHTKHAAPRLIGLCLSKLNEASLSKDQMADLRMVMRTLRRDLTAFPDPFVSQAAGQCLVAILKRTPFAADQHVIEETLLAILTAMGKAKVYAIIYVEACNIMATLLLQHRSRLRNRYHMVVKVFQAMMAPLFSGIEDDKHHRGADPTAGCARRLARLIMLFCEPPHSPKSFKTVSLVDEARQEQGNVGQHVHHLLHSFCSQVLASTVVEGLRETLTPAIWSIIEAMDINDAEGIKSLSAAMNNSERAVLRGVYSDWRRFGKWRGG